MLVIELGEFKHTKGVMLQPASAPLLFLYLHLFISIYLGHYSSGLYSLSVPAHSYCCSSIILLSLPSIVFYT